MRLGIFHRGVNENGLTAKDIVGDRDEDVAVPAPVLQQGPHLVGEVSSCSSGGFGEVLA